MALIALVREPSPRLDACELTWLERQPIDIGRARAQHGAYADWLEQEGLEVQWLEPLDQHPDGTFVEDAAVVLDEVAILCRPGAESRRGEVASVAGALEGRRRLERIESPATLDGGDVPRVGKRLWVGLSSRSNAEGARQLAAIAGRHGYRVEAVAVRGCLHLKSAVGHAGGETVLLNPQQVDPQAFAGLEVEMLPESEPAAADFLVLGAAAAVPTSFPETAGRLERLGLRVTRLELSELLRAEAGATCLSIIFAVGPG